MMFGGPKMSLIQGRRTAISCYSNIMVIPMMMTMIPTTVTPRSLEYITSTLFERGTCMNLADWNFYLFDGTNPCKVTLGRHAPWVVFASCLWQIIVHLALWTQEL